MQVRGRGFSELPSNEQQKWARASWLYGQWLCREATTYKLPVIAARPCDTLFECTLMELE
jgi:hypothetical protein